MFYYVSEDPDTLGSKVQSTDPESAVAAALDNGRVGGTAWTVRWNLKPDNASYVFARVTTVTGDPRTGASKQAESEAKQEAEAEAKRKAVEVEARQKAEAEAGQKALEAEAEAKQKALEAEAKQKALETEAKQKAPEAEATKPAAASEGSNEKTDT